MPLHVDSVLVPGLPPPHVADVPVTAQPMLSHKPQETALRRRDGGRTDTQPLPTWLSEVRAVGGAAHRWVKKLLVYAIA